MSVSYGVHSGLQRRYMSTMFPYITYDILYGDSDWICPNTEGRRPHNALSAAFVRSAKPGYYCDGNGLYLRVDRSGARRWEQRLRIQGRNRTLGLGGYQAGIAGRGAREGVHEPQDRALGR